MQRSSEAKRPSPALLAIRGEQAASRRPPDICR
jgi:hypothetical protein